MCVQRGAVPAVIIVVLRRGLSLISSRRDYVTAACTYLLGCRGRSPVLLRGVLGRPLLRGGGLVVPGAAAGSVAVVAGGPAVAGCTVRAAGDLGGGPGAVVVGGAAAGGCDGGRVSVRVLGAWVRVYVWVCVCARVCVCVDWLSVE